MQRKRQHHLPQKAGTCFTRMLALPAPLLPAPPSLNSAVLPKSAAHHSLFPQGPVGHGTVWPLRAELVAVPQGCVFEQPCGQAERGAQPRGLQLFWSQPGAQSVRVLWFQSGVSQSGDPTHGVPVRGSKARVSQSRVSEFGGPNSGCPSQGDPTQGVLTQGVPVRVSRFGCPSPGCPSSGVPVPPGGALWAGPACSVGGAISTTPAPWPITARSNLPRAHQPCGLLA